jgi:hypothetical protein
MARGWRKWPSDENEKKQPLRTDLLGQSLSIIGLKPPLSYNAMLTSISLAKYRYHILQVDWCFQQ